ncbi:Calx-beta domain-containing protein [Sphingomonas sp.]|uniref:Calx-beta domain-containing protein n=1 Tax=Sphingomonas sp. TaxID=28214 RepID=UPI0035BC8CD2
MATTTFINELHYDNVGTDSGEGFEIAGRAGTDLTGWKLVLYNGGSTAAAAANATVYNTINLTGTFADQANGYGTLNFTLPVDGLQNGSPDGFALIDAAGNVVQFLSYEGVLTAAAGTPAAGMTSVDVGVVEGTTTPVGTSLRLTGTGTTYEDFTWAGSAASSFGAVNQGQTFGSAAAPGSLSIAAASIVEGNSGTTSLVFTVTRSGGSDGAVTAAYDFTLGTATADDFASDNAFSGTVSFASGQTTATILAKVQGDTAVEADESFTVTLSGATGGAAIGTASATGTITNDDSAAAAPGRAFVNEILYDPAGADTGERVEIAGTAGLNLAGWTLVLYNGNGGAPYSTIQLSGVIPNQDDGNGALSFATPGIQNGAPDGLALVDANGAVVQFPSYEGSFTAVGGAANGLTSTDIGVAQSGTEPATLSLQLKGSGSDGEDFTWTAATTSSFGQVNAGQDFVVANPAGSIRVRDASVVEGDSGTTALTFTVDRTGGTTGAASADYAVSFGSGAGFASANDLTGATSGTVTFAAGQSQATITIQVATDTVGEPDERFSLTLSNASGGADLGRATATGTIVNDDLAQLRIFEIQGAAHRSPYEGQTVATQGIVTALASNGFYLQDATGDGDRATSDGVFVFTGTAPTVTVGDAVTMTARVDEFLPNGDTGVLPLTELVPTSITVVSTGNALPAAVLIGPDGIRPPTEILDDDNLTSFDPATDGLDFFESLEGMRVTVESPHTVAPTAGSVWTVAGNATELAATNVSADGHVVIDGGAGGLGVVNSGAGSDFNPERILIGSLTGGVPNVQAGAVLDDVTGVVSYRSGNYTVLATSAPTVATAAPVVADPTALAAASNQLLVATYNVLNLDPNDSDGDTDLGSGRFALIGQDIGVDMKAPDVVVLEEIQDNDGSANSGSARANVTLQTLVDAIFAQSGVRYTFIENPFVTDGTNGGEPGGNIQVAMIYRADRVQLVDGSVRSIPQAATQATDPTNPFSGARIPLVADFTFNGEDVTVIGNHFTSKGGSGALEGAIQPSLAGGEAKRAAQAAAVNDYVDSLLAANAGAQVIVAGDFNEFQFEEPLQVLTGAQTFANGAITGTGTAVLENLTYRLAANERYSYVFDGNAQQIDHVLVSAGLQDGALIDVLHLNRDEFASDHDPVLVQLTVGTPIVTQTGTAGAETLTGNDGRDQLAGFEGNDRLRGFGGNDVLFGGAGSDVLEGGTGNDRMEGGGGNDSYFVDATGDTVVELAGEGTDTVKTTLTSYTLGDNVEILQFQTSVDSTGTGNTLNNTLFGGAGDDTLSGLAGDDRLVGGAGNDVLIGGVGRDTLEGGAGADRFVFATGDFATLAKADTIKDFDVNSGDVIDLANAGVTDFIGFGAFTGTAGEVRAQVIGAFTFVYGDVDGDGVADFAIQLTGTQALQADDFVLAGSIPTL